MSSPYFDTRIAAEKDLRISAQAYRALCCVCSHRAGRDTDEDFPLQWWRIGGWLGLAEDQAYRVIRELVAADYLKLGELKNCPPERHYFFLPNSRKNAGIDSREKAGIKPRTEAGNESRKKAGPPISNSLREESSLEGLAVANGKEASDRFAHGRTGEVGTEHPGGLRPIDWAQLKREAGLEEAMTHPEKTGKPLRDGFAKLRRAVAARKARPVRLPDNAATPKTNGHKVHKRPGKPRPRLRITK